MIPREGPRVEIKRGSWEERLREIDARARSARAAAPAAGGPPRWALVVEPSPASGPLVAAVRPLLGEDVLAIQAKDAPLKLSTVLDRLKEADAEDPLVGVCVVGTGDRDDARKAGWNLDRLARREWVFAHASVPPSALVPTIGEKVDHFLDVIDGIAFMEGPKPARR